jgi:hypothetical protein
MPWTLPCLYDFVSCLPAVSDCLSNYICGLLGWLSDAVVPEYGLAAVVL